MATAAFATARLAAAGEPVTPPTQTTNRRIAPMLDAVLPLGAAFLAALLYACRADA